MYKVGERTGGEVERGLKFIYGEFSVDNMDGMEYARLVLWPLT